MNRNADASGWKSQLVLHSVFTLTGIAHIVGGAVMPSIAATFHLSDRQSGTLFLLYFGGSALGALLCRGNYVRDMWMGFAAMSVFGVGVGLSSATLLPAAFLLFGVSVGMAMSAVSLFVGRNIAAKRASVLTLLNFSWSCGALLSPLLAGWLLQSHTYRAVYFTIAAVSLPSALVCALTLRDHSESEVSGTPYESRTALGLILLFAFAAFMQVGIENTSTAWLTTFTMREAGNGIVMAAYATSLYWAGFLISRAAASVLLLKAKSDNVLVVCVAAALLGAVLLVAASTVVVRSAAMLILGASLAPIYPLILNGFFARARRTGDSRWILATAGFGGSILPWFAGMLSTQSGSLRVGMMLIPAALLALAVALPAMRVRDAKGAA